MDSHLNMRCVPAAAPQHVEEVRRHTDNSNITQQAVQSLEVCMASTNLLIWLITTL